MAAQSVFGISLKRGIMSFGVSAYKANDDPNDETGTHQHCPECRTRVKQVLQCPQCNKEVQRGSVINGYEHAKDQVVFFTSEEIKALKGDRQDAIGTIEAFIPTGRLERRRVERTYFLAPSDKVHREAFEAFRDVLLKLDVAAVVSTILYNQDRAACVVADGDGLMLHLLLHEEYLRTPDEIGKLKDVQAKALPMNVLQMQQLVENLTDEDFDFSAIVDKRAERFAVAVKAKLAGEAIVTRPAEAPPISINFFDALKAEIAASQGRQKRTVVKPVKVAKVVEAKKAKGKKAA